MKYKLELLPCKICQKPYTWWKSKANYYSVYCSVKCEKSFYGKDMRLAKSRYEEVGK